MNNKEISAIRNRLKQLDIEKAELERRLAALVKERAPENNQQQTAGRVTNQSGASEKITLFRSLFRGREDVFPKRWENTRTGKSGYAPACGNEWLAMELHLPPAEDDEEPWKALPSGSKPSTEITASLDALLQHDTGVLAATTAFGKTVVAAFIIAARKTNTLVLVHRRQLMEQWIARLSTFLDLPASSIGQIGGGKRKPSGGVDVAVLQSLVRKGEVDDIVADYGQIVVDECHHVSAVSFEAAVRAVKAKYVLGLSATVTRQDGQHPIIFMQCGPVRYRTHAKAQARQRSFAHRVLIRTTDFRISPDPGQERLPFPGRGYWSNTSAACTGRTRKRGKRWSMTTWTALFPYLSAWATNVFGVTGISVILWRMLPELPASDTAVPLLADN